MLDGEDAIALGDEVAGGEGGGRRRPRRPTRPISGRQPARTSAAGAQPRHDGPRPVRAPVAAPRADAGRGAAPLDGIVFPKVEHPEEVDLVNGRCLDMGRAGPGAGAGPIRVAYLVESDGPPPAAGDRPAGRRRVWPARSSASRTTAPTSACRRSATSTRSRSGRGPTWWRWPEPGRARDRWHDPRLPGRDPALDASGEPRRWLDRLLASTTRSVHATLGCSAGRCIQPSFRSRCCSLEAGLTDEAMEHRRPSSRRTMPRWQPIRSDDDRRAS